MAHGRAQINEPVDSTDEKATTDNIAEGYRNEALDKRNEVRPT